MSIIKYGILKDVLGSCSTLTSSLETAQSINSKQHKPLLKITLDDTGKVLKVVTVKQKGKHDVAI